MIRANLGYSGNMPVEVTFQHQNPTLNGVQQRKKGRWTRCSVRVYVPNGEMIQHTEVVKRCHSGDNFDRSVGRKLALEEAMKQLNFDRNERTQVWSAYHAKCKR